MPRKLTDKQETERQLKDAETLRSATKGGFIVGSKATKIKAPNPMFEHGEWRVAGYHHRGDLDE